MWLDAGGKDNFRVVIGAISFELCSALQNIAGLGNLPGVLNGKNVTVSITQGNPISLQEQWDAAAGCGHIGKLRVEFLVPTSFRRDGAQVLFPEPTLLFKNVYTKAVTYGGDFIAANLVRPEEFSGQLQVSRYELSTRELNYDRYKIIGCTGYAVYDYRAIKTPYLLQSLAFLSALAEFTGIGYKTTMGMGRVKCMLGGKIAAMPGWIG